MTEGEKAGQGRMKGGRRGGGAGVAAGVLDVADEGYDVADGVRSSYAIFLASTCLCLFAFLMASSSLSTACHRSPLC